MNTRRNFILAGVLCLWLAALAHGQQAQAPARTMLGIQGKVTIQGKPAKIGQDTYLVQVGADYATFELRLPNNRTFYRLFEQALARDKGIKVVGNLHAEMQPGVVAWKLVLDKISDVAVEGNGVTDNKVEGDVQIRGMLLKEGVPGLTPAHALPADWKTDAFILHVIPGLRSLPVHFDNGAAKKAENMYGRLVVIHCKMQSFDLGLRPQCFLYTCNDIQIAGK